MWCVHDWVNIVDKQTNQKREMNSHELKLQGGQKVGNGKWETELHETTWKNERDNNKI